MRVVLCGFLSKLISQLVYKGHKAGMEGDWHMRRIVIACSLVLLLCTPALADDCLKVSEGCTPVVSFDLRDVELRVFLEGAALEYGINMVISSEVKGSVSASLHEVGLFDAIDSIVSSQGYVRREIKGGLMVVEPASESDLRERDLLVRQFRLKYLDVGAPGLLNTVSSVLSKRGSVMPVAGSNSIVVKDISAGVDHARTLIDSLDREPRQVVVEARMVEIAKGSASELGINWSAAHSETSGNVFGGLGTVEESFGVNLPEAEGLSDAGGLLGFSVISDRVSLDLRIQALETAHEARTVSSPRVQVAENVKAVISDGEEIVVPSMQAQTVVRTGDDGASAGTVIRPQTFRAVLGLSVTPRVVAPGRVALDLEVRREWFDHSEDKKVEGVPLKLTKTISTSVFLSAGQTIAIGGIETDMNKESEARVPLLSRIPILGALFRSKAKEGRMTELVIFLTPYIVGEDENVAGTSQGN